MDEYQLELIFKKFLKSKGYPAESLLSQVDLLTVGRRVFRPDLVILDLSNREYIAIIEFKSSADEKTIFNSLNLFHEYHAILGRQPIPAYLVLPVNEDDFQILSLKKENSYSHIPKEDFPEFETLAAKRLTDEKMSFREVEKKTLFELEQRKKKARLSAYWTLLSLILGISVSIFIIISQRTGLVKTNDVSIICCDSVQKQYEQLNQRLHNLEAILTGTQKINNDTQSLSSIQYKIIDKRIKIIEDGILSSPEKTFANIDLRNEIKLLKQTDQHLKELNQTKIESLKSEMEIQNAWTIGVLLAILGGIISMVLPNIIPRRNERINGI
jgi:hypothetical protein